MGADRVGSSGPQSPGNLGGDLGLEIRGPLSPYPSRSAFVRPSSCLCAAQVPVTSPSRLAVDAKWHLPVTGQWHSDISYLGKGNVRHPQFRAGESSDVRGGARAGLWPLVPVFTFSPHVVLFCAALGFG